MSLCNHTFESAISHLRFSLVHIFSGIIASIFVFAISRFVFISNFSSELWPKLSFLEQKSFLISSLLFDIKYSALLFLPAVLFGLLFCFRQKVSALYKKYFWCYELFAFLWVLTISIVNYYYYKTYGRFIDSFIFSFFKEEPHAVLMTLINDYPLFSGLAVISIVALVYMMVVRKIIVWVFNKTLILPKNSKILCFLMIFVLVGLYVLAIRGSVTTFPLRQNDYQVTRYAPINNAVPNGYASFAWAYKWYSKQGKIPNVSVEQIAASWNKFGIKVTGNEVFQPLLHRTAKNEFLEKNQPNVVFALMESMSTHMLSYDANNFDLYGSLRNHAKDDYFFLNFVSEGNGTIDSLTRLLVSVPNMDLSTSSDSTKKYITNMLRPYKEKGYKAIFITSGAGSWRNISNFLIAQGFDEVIEKSTIQAMYNDTTEGTWGIDDEFLFRAAKDVLMKQKQPTIMFLLSITNHPPYRIPEGAKHTKFNASDETASRFPYEKSELNTIFGTFTYANDSLGNFVSAIKADQNLANKTFIAASGDHNLRGIGYSNYPSEAVIGHAVPFYLYIPQIYKDNEHLTYDKGRLGSHKDIFATITEHALSDAEYYSFGCDLLGDNSCKFPYAYNSEIVAINDNDNYFACVLNSGEFAFPYVSLYGLNANIDQDSYFEKNAHLRLLKPIVADLSNNRTQDCTKAITLSELQSQLYYYGVNHQK